MQFFMRIACRRGKRGSAKRRRCVIVETCLALLAFYTPCSPFPPLHLEIRTCTRSIDNNIYANALTYKRLVTKPEDKKLSETNRVQERCERPRSYFYIRIFQFSSRVEEKAVPEAAHPLIIRFCNETKKNQRHTFYLVCF